MKHPILTLAAGMAAGLISTNPGFAHSGSLVGHPKTSPSWSTIMYFVACKTMEDCVRSGRKRHGS